MLTPPLSPSTTPLFHIPLQQNSSKNCLYSFVSSPHHPFSLETTSVGFLSLSCCSVPWSVFCTDNTWLLGAFDTADHTPSVCCAFFIWLHLAGIPHSWFSFNLTGYSFLDFFYRFLFFSRINPVLVLFLFSIYIYSLDNLFQIHDFKYHLYANESQFISLNQTSFLNSRPV